MARNVVWMLGGGSVVAGAAVAAWIVMESQRSLPETPGPAPAETVAAPAPAPTQAPTQAPAAAQQTAEVAPAETPAPPVFDVVRVAQDGAALVAGSAAPGAAVTLRVDGVAVAQTAADASGQFVAMFDLGSSDAAQVMTLEMADAEGQVTVSEDTLVLTPRPVRMAAVEPEAAPVVADPAPVAAPAVAPTAEAAPDPVQIPIPEAQSAAPVVVADDAPTETQAPTEMQARTETQAPAVLAEAPVAPDLPTPEAAPPAPEPAPRLAAAEDMPSGFLVRGGGAVQLLDRAPRVMDNVVIDTISYTAQGDVQIAGRAANTPPEASLRIYLDNRPIAVARSERGDWTTDLPHVDPGVYTLRVDQLDEAGQVVSRFETPFQREEPEVVARAQARLVATQPAAPDPASEPAPDPAPESAPRQVAALEPEPQPVPAPEQPQPAVPPAAPEPVAAVEPPSPSVPGETASPAPVVAAPDDQPAAEQPAIAQAVPDEPIAEQAAPQEPAQTAAASSQPAAPAPRDVSAVQPSAPANAAPQVSLVTVQPGHTLWAISQSRYGSGELYVLIYRANRSQIRDPDLIYPGQIFELPEN